MDDKRFIVWFYLTDPIPNEETYDDSDSFDQREEAEKAAIRMLKSGAFKTAILTDENWIELDRWTKADLD